MFKVFLSEDDSITIPPEILKELGIEFGDDVEFFVQDESIVLKKLEIKKGATLNEE